MSVSCRASWQSPSSSSQCFHSPRSYSGTSPTSRSILSGSVIASSSLLSSAALTSGTGGGPASGSTAPQPTAASATNRAAANGTARPRSGMRRRSMCGSISGPIGLSRRPHQRGRGRLHGGRGRLGEKREAPAVVKHRGLGCAGSLPFPRGLRPVCLYLRGLEGEEVSVLDGDDEVVAFEHHQRPVALGVLDA